MPTASSPDVASPTTSKSIQQVEHHFGRFAEWRLVVDDQDAYGLVAHDVAVPSLFWFAR